MSDTMAVQLVNQGGELTVKDVLAQVAKVQELMKLVMKEGEHYGVIPGTNKPSLLKPGAEKLGFVFRHVPSYEVTERDLGDGHREYRITCSLRSQSGDLIAQGVGCCSTMESKYRYRNSARLCPACGKAAIIKGKEEYGGGWLCFKKKDGCGAKFADGDKSIEGQSQGQMENPDLADVWNTVLKMAKKRAHVDAEITACAASDIFTQDVEDMPRVAAAATTDAPAETTGGSVRKAIARDPEVQQLFAAIGAASQDKVKAKAQCLAILETQLTREDVIEAATRYLEKLEATDA